jgi:hypothetical protein
MHDEQLQRLLDQADSTAQPARVQPGLAQRVRRRAKHRKRVRASIASAMVLTIAMAAVWRLRPRESSIQSVAVQPKPPVAQTQVATLDPAALRELHRAEAAASDEAELHLQIANAMLKQQSKPSTRESLASDVLVQSEVLASLMEYRARTAHLMLKRGDSLLQDDARSAAMACYRRVMTLFPDSAEAAVARERLGRLGA